MIKMALTRAFKETVQTRVARDPAFQQALLAEAVNTLLEGDRETGKEAGLSAVTKIIAAREAVEQLKLLNASAVPTIAGLLQDEMHDHPRAIATRYRKSGTQISDDKKKMLGIRRNGFMSLAALADLTETGKADPLTAHEQTLLRATFTLSRSKCIGKEAEFQAQLGKCFIGFKHETLHRNCPACNRLDGMVTSAADAAVLPPKDCVPGCTANYGLGPAVDWLAALD